MVRVRGAGRSFARGGVLRHGGRGFGIWKLLWMVSGRDHVCCCPDVFATMRCGVAAERSCKCDDKDELCADEAEGYGCTCGRVPELSPASSTVWSTTTDVMPSATSQASPDERRLRRQRSSPIKGDQRSAVSDSYLHSAHVVVILCWDVLRLCTAIAGAYALSRTSSIYSNLSSCPW